MRGISPVLPSAPPRPFRAACIQFNPRLNAREENVDALLELVNEAARSGAKLIVTPEMATTGYHYASRAAIQPFVDTIPGATTARFEPVAREFGTYIVIGMPEVDPDSGIFYLAAALIGPEGVIGKYRKVHLWEAEGRWAAPGDLGFPVYATGLGRIAMNICMDAIYPESARLAAVQGADILAFLTNSTAQSLATLQDRACANGLYVVGANRSNTENGYHMVGTSAIWSPYGKKLAETAYVATEAAGLQVPTILYAEIDPADYTNPAKERLRERRPELYRELMLAGSPWDTVANPTSHEVSAALLQYRPVPGDRSANLRTAADLLVRGVTRCREQGGKLQLVVLPELSFLGPVVCWRKNKISLLAEPEQGPSLQAVGQWASDFGLHIVFGFLEEDQGRLFNTAALVGPDGELIGKYRKTHLTAAEKRWATPGDQIPVFATDLGTIGLMIGYDAAFPEVAGVLAVRRADLIAVPSSWAGEFGAELQLLPQLMKNPHPAGAISCWEAIATGAQAYTLVANFTGTPRHYRGGSALYGLDPYYGLDQAVIAGPDQEDALLVRFSTLQNRWWVNQAKTIQSRRTLFYRPLVVPMEKGESPRPRALHCRGRLLAVDTSSLRMD